jgi:hypothetical protein
VRAQLFCRHLRATPPVRASTARSSALARHISARAERRAEETSALVRKLAADKSERILVSVQQTQRLFLSFLASIAGIVVSAIHPGTPSPWLDIVLYCATWALACYLVCAGSLGYGRYARLAVLLKAAEARANQQP